MIKKNKMSEVETRYHCALYEYERIGNSECLVELYNMLKNEDLVCKVRTTGKLYFKAESTFRHECCVCGECYEQGEPCFFRDKKGWHEKCASEEDKKLPYYQGYLRNIQSKKAQGVIVSLFNKG